jgi:hypothetical protein
MNNWYVAAGVRRQPVRVIAIAAHQRAAAAAAGAPARAHRYVTTTPHTTLRDTGPYTIIPLYYQL